MNKKTLLILSTILSISLLSLISLPAKDTEIPTKSKLIEHLKNALPSNVFASYTGYITSNRQDKKEIILIQLMDYRGKLKVVLVAMGNIKAIVSGSVTDEWLPGDPDPVKVKRVSFAGEQDKPYTGTIEGFMILLNTGGAYLNLAIYRKEGTEKWESNNLKKVDLTLGK